MSVDDDKSILVDGMIKLCTDLDVSPSDIAVLVLAWKFKAATACVFTTEEFDGGMERIGSVSTCEKAVISSFGVLLM